MKAVAYIRVRDTYLLSVSEQESKLSEFDVIKRFEEDEPSDDRPNLGKAIELARKEGCILAVPAMFRDLKTLERLQNSGVEVFPSVKTAIRRANARIRKLNRGIQAAKDRGVKFGAARDDFDPTWRDTSKAAKVSASRRTKSAREFYAPVVPEIQKMRDQGMSYAAIADELNALEYTTSAGGSYNASTIIRILQREGKYEPAG